MDEILNLIESVSEGFPTFSIYNDGMGPVEVERRSVVVVEKNQCTVYISLCYQIDLVTLYIDRQTYFMHQFSSVMLWFSENKRNYEIGIL